MPHAPALPHVEGSVVGDPVPSQLGGGQRQPYVEPKHLHGTDSLLSYIGVVSRCFKSQCVFVLRNVLGGIYQARPAVPCRTGFDPNTVRARTAPRRGTAGGFGRFMDTP